jgi:NAD-dependent deacetylase
LIDQVEINVSAIIEFIKESQYCVALTGAGISTLSGIPDFRGKTGIYNQYDINKIFDYSCFLSNPSYYYGAAKDFIYNIESRKPNIIHFELARLESSGLLKSIITQNIDLLHSSAGSKKVIELHGSPHTHTCLNCGKKYDYTNIARIVRQDEIPICNFCNGSIKPDITFFGESLDPSILQRAVEECSKADLILALGTSLVVQPAASLPLYSLENGGSLVIVNAMETPLDEIAAGRYPDLEKVFAEIKDSL